MSKTNVVVIGSGIIGTAVAFELQSRGTEALLVERDANPQGASAFSFASLTAFDERQRDVYLLKGLGLAGWKTWTKRFGDELGVTWDGEIRWAETRPAARQLSELVDRAFARGYPVRQIRAREITEKLPGSEPGAVFGASYASEDGQAEPLRAIAVLRRAFLEAGGNAMVGRASLAFDGAAVQVRVGEVTVEPDLVVIAAGAETSALLNRFGWDIPMQPSPGFLTLTKPTSPVVKGTVYVTLPSGAAIHLRQLSSGGVLIGERAQDEVATDPSMHHAEKLLQQAQIAFPALHSTTVDRFTVEWRPMPRDGKPIVGLLPGLPNVYLTAAHSGVTLAPAIGALAAQEIVEGKHSDRLEPFRPARFGQELVDAERIIEEAFSAPADAFLG